ncbi:MAG: biotin--[acetyl-CoA-carboxylase] ligase [Alistipes sp.]|nr:biotin--[acetyl-CoA-carboxylase] ligase [Alistipes sp.]
MIHHLTQTTSTNDEARDRRYAHGDIVWAERQTAGRGQRGHSWSSAEGFNLTFSLVWEPRFLKVAEQFLLSQAVALALTDLMAEEGIDARIKWTNDIYAGDRKAVGMLIENDLAGDRLARTIVGIGVNVNQTEFDPSLPNPCSMRQLTGREYDRRELLERLAGLLDARYRQLERGDRQTLREAYRRRLYRLDERHAYRYPDGRTVQAVLRDVRPTGELLLELPDGRTEGYLFREIEFVIAAKESRATETRE